MLAIRSTIVLLAVLAAASLNAQSWMEAEDCHARNARSLQSLNDLVLGQEQRYFEALDAVSAAIEAIDQNALQKSNLEVMAWSARAEVRKLKQQYEQARKRLSEAARSADVPLEWQRDGTQTGQTLLTFALSSDLLDNAGLSGLAEQATQLRLAVYQQEKIQKLWEDKVKESEANARTLAGDKADALWQAQREWNALKSAENQRRLFQPEPCEDEEQATCPVISVTLDLEALLGPQPGNTGVSPPTIENWPEFFGIDAEDIIVVPQPEDGGLDGFPLSPEDIILLPSPDTTELNKVLDGEEAGGAPGDFVVTPDGIQVVPGEETGEETDSGALVGLGEAQVEERLRAAERRRVAEAVRFAEDFGVKPSPRRLGATELDALWPAGGNDSPVQSLEPEQIDISPTPIDLGLEEFWQDATGRRDADGNFIQPQPQEQSQVQEDAVSLVDPASLTERQQAMLGQLPEEVQARLLERMGHGAEFDDALLQAMVIPPSETAKPSVDICAVNAAAACFRLRAQDMTGCFAMFQELDASCQARIARSGDGSLEACVANCRSAANEARAGLAVRDMALARIAGAVDPALDTGLVEQQLREVQRLRAMLVEALAGRVVERVRGLEGDASSYLVTDSEAVEMGGEKLFLEPSRDEQIQLQRLLQREQDLAGALAELERAADYDVVAHWAKQASEVWRNSVGRGQDACRTQADIEAPLSQCETLCAAQAQSGGGAWVGDVCRQSASPLGMIDRPGIERWLDPCVGARP